MRKKRLFKNLPKIQAKRHAKFRWEKFRRQAKNMTARRRGRKKRVRRR